MLEAFFKATLLEKLGALGSIASIIALIPIVIVILRGIGTADLWTVLREFLRLFLTVRTGLVGGIFVTSSVYAIILIKMQSSSGLVSSISFLSGFILSFEVYWISARMSAREVILGRIRSAYKKYGSPCSAAKFDVDLIVAINDYSPDVGSQIVTAFREILAQQRKALASRGVRVVSTELPESDEVIWIVPNLNEEQLADVSDTIRRDVKRRLMSIANYDHARAHVVSSLKSPPLTAEEQEGVGTLSSGVASYRSSAEQLLSDISSAAKMCKFRGRNRTIIWRGGGIPIVREH